MILFPAIDVLEGRAVRLLYGEKNKVTDYGDVLERAKQWKECGAEWLHLVDLSGAFDGMSNVDKFIEKIRSLDLKIQSGGGLRSMQAIENRLSAGADRVVLGTLCVKDPDLYKKAVEKYGERIVAGIDAKDGYIYVDGWTKNTGIKALDFAKTSYEMGVRYAVATDISKDGAMQGVSVDYTAEIQQKSGLNVVASGGVSSLSDLEKLKERKIYGAILGRSIYNGAIDLKEAVEKYDKK